MILPAVVMLAASVTAAADTIRDVVATIRRGGRAVVAAETLASCDQVALFYERRHLQPAWTPRAAASMLLAIDAADDDGLEPAEYHRAWLRSPAGTAEERDLVLTDAFMTLAAHLATGRVNPRSLIREWCLPARNLDLASVLESALLAGDIAAMLRQISPRHPPYVRLKSALREFREMPDWPPLPTGRPLRLGDSGDRVVALRQRLLLEDSEGFDEELRERVVEFQARHGLTPDGVVGTATLAELNVSRLERIRQLELNLERWRWMPESLGTRHVIVNIAAFALLAVEHERVALTMRTIVGKHYTKTPFFTAHLRQVIVNPYWNVPSSIAVKELLPEESAKPGSLARQQIEILPGRQLRQRPGPWNALGRIKIDMPNPFTVYLHDTPAKSLFKLSQRTFSHGCIRLENAAALAIWLLDDARWTSDALQRMVAAEETRAIDLREPVPVYVLYWTAYVREDGSVQFRRDIYDRDAELSAALRRAPPWMRT
jgi:murein L,D-transpeptidase YcbB/YkuD